MSIFQFTEEYNQRQPPDKKSEGAIQRFRKNKMKI
ncbi:hypothetical protein DOK78_001725 [Enterococcus sp. DIV2402]|uniref:Uncharacterized protein n=1 Tax=Candidatus Enterococcus lowellii TaxID=2230877 RepID=A0ABZ2SMN9_9ENTE